MKRKDLDKSPVLFLSKDRYADDTDELINTDLMLLSQHILSSRDSIMNSLSTMWMALFPIVYKMLTRKKKVKVERVEQVNGEEN